MLNYFSRLFNEVALCDGAIFDAALFFLHFWYCNIALQARRNRGRGAAGAAATPPPPLPQDFS